MPPTPRTEGPASSPLQARLGEAFDALALGEDEPYYAQNWYLLWTVEQESTPGLLTIDQNGVAHAAAPGSAVVRVTSQIEPTATATVAVTVG